MQMRRRRRPSCAAKCARQLCPKGWLLLLQRDGVCAKPIVATRRLPACRPIWLGGASLPPHIGARGGLAWARTHLASLWVVPAAASSFPDFGLELIAAPFDLYSPGSARPTPLTAAVLTQMHADLVMCAWAVRCMRRFLRGGWITRPCFPAGEIRSSEKRVSRVHTARLRFLGVTLPYRSSLLAPSNANVIRHSSCE